MNNGATELTVGARTLPQVYDTFAIAEMVSIVPMSSTVSPEDMHPNISTLHITYQGPQVNGELSKTIARDLSSVDFMQRVVLVLSSAFSAPSFSAPLSFPSYSVSSPFPFYRSMQC
jgi:hypothetical protein